MSASRIKIADIFNAAFKEYVDRYGPLTHEQYRAANAIMSCHTEKLGYHQYQCETCDQPQMHFHSCRNRHCPACQGYASMQWVQARMEELLPVDYFHAVFTIPAELNPFALRNKKAVYAILYRAVNDTLSQIAQQPKWLGARIGFIGVLHTWGQTLQDHPHLHCIIPAGGLRLKDDRWKSCRNNFFAPIAVLQKVFCGKFMEYFKLAIDTKQIEFHGILQQYSNPQSYAKLIDELYRKPWVVYIKPSFASPQAVLNYLGNYTHRIAISEKRIVSFRDGKVSFFYTDYRDENRRKIISLPVVEFIRRFMLHVLPRGFMRIRHFGIFANKNRLANINYCRKLLGEHAIDRMDKRPSWWEQILQRTGRNPLICPKCNSGLLKLIMIVPPRRLSPMLT